jgi:hypothetical protein
MAATRAPTVKNRQRNCKSLLTRFRFFFSGIANRSAALYDVTLHAKEMSDMRTEKDCARTANAKNGMISVFETWYA